MAERIKYIDALKGLAILLMVMGHIIARQFPSWQVALNDVPRNAMLLWRIIYSFHMPLLMFCSGLFALSIREYTWRSIGRTIWKRVYSLLIPCLTSGYLAYLVSQGYTKGYWFLWVLFQFIIVVLAIDGLCSLLPKYSQVVSTCLIIVAALWVHIYYHKLYAYEYLPWIDIGHWRQFPFFCMGVVCARYDLCERWFSKKWVYTCALLLFGFLTYWITINDYRIPKQTITWCLLPIAAIVTCVYLFIEGLSGRSKWEMYLQDIGRHSLEIYIIHVFFLFETHSIGKFAIEQANAVGGRTIFFAQITTSFIASVVIILLCYVVIAVINKSSLLSIILLGRRSEKN